MNTRTQGVSDIRLIHKNENNPELYYNKQNI